MTWLDELTSGKETAGNVRRLIFGNEEHAAELAGRPKGLTAEEYKALKAKGAIDAISRGRLIFGGGARAVELAKRLDGLTLQEYKALLKGAMAAHDESFPWHGIIDEIEVYETWQPRDYNRAAGADAEAEAEGAPQSETVKLETDKYII